MPRYVIDPADLKFVIMAMEERCAAESDDYKTCVRGGMIVLDEMQGIIKPHKPVGQKPSLNGKKKRKY